MITLTQSKSKADLQGIIDLQKANLSTQISIDEKESQGFVFVRHSLEDLAKLNAIEAHIIARDGNYIAAYILAMTKASKADIPQLVPMFYQFDEIEYMGKKVSGYNYIAVGQVCIGKSYRGGGLFDKCYEKYKEVFEEKYDFAITEISTSNLRSIRAHLRIGFEVIHTFHDNVEEWNIVIWDWMKKS
ncbi:GNAT family N-acetyltransferase [Algoriphagus sp. Y33]|uniref:GNAT family N-acetyltransferase n=1 Tax=Algoriphagus sp. Y33 TaxID=2772483 RepID=UPI00177E9C55|nr:GNAT family N-acetyltransferase [Algoriphagus sp. Y33]